MSDPGAAPLREVTALAVRALVLYGLAEHQGGHATTLTITAAGDTFGFSDDGRGHPLDRTVEGHSYLDFIYTHFDYPFEPGRAAPVQLHGIGMSLVNALCSELTLTVHKRDACLTRHFRDGRSWSTERTAQVPEETGITVCGTIRPALCGDSVAVEALEAWLLGVLATSPSLRLVFNGRPLVRPADRAA